MSSYTVMNRSSSCMLSPTDFLSHQGTPPTTDLILNIQTQGTMLSKRNVVKDTQYLIILTKQGDTVHFVFFFLSNQKVTIRDVEMALFSIKERMKGKTYKQL